ncbi:hypothetical protein ES702_01040 [subsurface metagenome]
MIESINSEYIKPLREKLNWSQERLARNLSVSVNTIRRWEKGLNEPSSLAKKALLDLLKRTKIKPEDTNSGS